MMKTNVIDSSYVSAVSGTLKPLL